ncbi:tripartite tricarboxylate transporter permease [Salibacterium aidingense]|uniref:tripartite tricarboxylate transporter permease n=1 Tax=Salibacterium aidingense TaxID=384933 RepID=UPI003BDFE050
MENIQEIAPAFQAVFSFTIILWVCVGVVLGMVFGATPGLTATTGVAVFTPLTFEMSFDASLGFLLGIYCGGYYSGSIPAILIKTPGAPGNAATALDGYPMSMQGLAGKALGYSVVSSFIGASLSILALFLFAPVIGSFALSFGPPEYFAIGLLGLICVAGVSEGSLLKGIAAALLGMILGVAGQDPMGGMLRFTFGNIELNSGISLIPALIGLFAVTEVLTKSESIKKSSVSKVNKIKDTFPRFVDYWKHKWLLVKSSIIGLLIGSLPGTGPTIASWIGYNEAKRKSKTPERFGEGAEEGIISSESSNNAVTGGALIPLLTLGIPGDTVTAILLGALLIQGVTPGPAFMTEQYNLFAELLWILILANIFMLCFGFLGTKIFPKLLKTPLKIMLPLIIVLCATGGFAVNNSMFDVKILVILGVAGFFLYKFGFPIPPIVLGLVLGPIIEPNLMRGLVMTDMNPLLFFTRPVSGIILSLIIGSIVFMSIRFRKRRA